MDGVMLDSTNEPVLFLLLRSSSFSSVGSPSPARLSPSTSGCGVFSLVLESCCGVRSDKNHNYGFLLDCQSKEQTCALGRKDEYWWDSRFKKKKQKLPPVTYGPLQGCHHNYCHGDLFSTWKQCGKQAEPKVSVPLSICTHTNRSAHLLTTKATRKKSLDLKLALAQRQWRWCSYRRAIALVFKPKLRAVYQDYHNIPLTRWVVPQTIIWNGS